MKKLKLFQAARKLKLSSSALIKLMEELGLGKKSSHSYISEEEFNIVKNKLLEEKRRIKQSLKKRGGKPRKEEKAKIDEKEIEKSLQRTLMMMERRKIRKKPPTKKVEPSEVEEDKEKKKKIKVIPYMSVAELAHVLDVAPSEIIKRCLEMGTFATINQRLDMDTIEVLLESFGYEVEKEEEIKIEEQEQEEKKLVKQRRPPVVVILGHVDHGKTTLLDYIRKTNIAAKEYGRITQRIGAYTAQIGDFKIVFLDTPGHEAFTAMRTRGAQVADIAVLVVAADDGVKPQTVEAIDHAKAANLPLIVAITKIDLPNANPSLVKSQLAEKGVVVEDFGGDVIAVEVSGITGEGVPDLLDAIQLKAMELPLETPFEGKAKGTVIEAKLDKRRGNIATILIYKGELKRGDPFVCGEYAGKVREIFDENGKRVDVVKPGMPVQILGLPGVPEPGETFETVSSENIAKEIAKKRELLKRERILKEKQKLSLQAFQEAIQKGEVKELKLIIKGDVYGSVEALQKSLEDLSIEDVRVSVIHTGIGAINVSDVNLAKASGAVIIGFHVTPLADARELAEKEGVEIRTYKLIYDVIDDVRAAMVGLLEPEKEEVPIGKAEVRKVFKISKVGIVAGCYVLEGKVEKDAKVRVYRGKEEIADTEIESLKRFDKSVSEVEAGYECGIKLLNFDNVAEGDILSFYRIVEKKREW